MSTACQCLGDGRGRCAGHDPCAVDGSVLQHVGCVGEGDVFRLDVFRELHAGRREVDVAFVINGRPCGSYGKFLALEAFEAVDIRIGCGNNLVRVEVKSADGFEVLVRMAFKAVSTVQTLVHVAGNRNRYLRFAVRDHIEVRDAACGGLAGCLHAWDILAPHIRDGCAYGIECTGCACSREVDADCLACCRLRLCLSAALFISASCKCSRQNECCCRCCHCLFPFAHFTFPPMLLMLRVP